MTLFVRSFCKQTFVYLLLKQKIVSKQSNFFKQIYFAKEKKEIWFFFTKQRKYCKKRKYNNRSDKVGVDETDEWKSGDIK